MARVVEQRGRRPLLHQPAEIHHADPIAEVTHDGQVVGDEEVRQAVPVAQLDEEVEDLRLHDDVERRGRLVENDEARAGRQRARDHDALALPARELVRIAAQVDRQEPDVVEQAGDALPEVGTPGEPVGRQRLRDQAVDGQPRVERRGRLLEDELDLAAQAPA